MTPETCKQLLAIGILQAYAEGKEVQTLACGEWVTYDSYNFDSSPKQYRIKPTPQFEVGDLVKVPSGCICKVTQVFPDACEVQPTTGGNHNVVHNSCLTKVREVRTPFTFEEAVKACAEHGMMVTSKDGLYHRILALDEDSVSTIINGIGIDGPKTLMYRETFDLKFTSDNTPFCNISYENITS